MNQRVSSSIRGGLVVLWLVAVWSMLWGMWRLDVVLSGVLVAAAVVKVSHFPALPMRTSTRWSRVPGLVLRLCVDMLRSSWQVAATTARRGHRTRSSLVAVRLPAGSSDTALVLACNRLSLEPGSIVVDIDRPRDLLYVYVLDTPDHEAVERGRNRVQRVLDDVTTTFASRGSAAGEGVEERQDT